MKITRQTETTLQFQSNPVWWSILGFAFGSLVFLYNANSKNLVLNKNSPNQATLEVVDRWLGLYETNLRHITDVRDIEIRKHDSKRQMVAITSNGAVPIDPKFSSGIEDSKRFQFVDEAKALLHSPRKGKVSARVSYALLLGIFDGLLLIASLASCCKIQGLLDSEKNLFVLRKRYIFGVRKRKIALSQIQSFAIELTQGKRKRYENFKTSISNYDSLDSYCVSVILQNEEAISLSPSFSEPSAHWHRLVSALNQFLKQFQDHQKSLKPCALCGNSTAGEERFQDDANRYYHPSCYKRYSSVS